MIRALLSLYTPAYPRTIVYMLQNTEYQPLPYLAWFWQTQDFSRVEYRRTLERTRAARALLLALRLGMLVQIVGGLVLLCLWWRYHTPGLWEFGVALLLSYPIIWAHLIILPLIAGRLFIVGPRNTRRVKAGERIFAKHPGQKVAVVGSYGKTSMKELLLTVLGEGLTVAATPANKNVASSHAVFARRLTGKEDVLLVEYGEGAPGDVARFAKLTHPDRAVITGVAAAHLDRYQSTEAAGRDIFSVAAYIADQQHVYVNAESAAAVAQPHQAFTLYDRQGTLGWAVQGVQIGLEGTAFTMTKDGAALHIHSKLIGGHQVGPLVLAAALAHELGMGKQAIEAGIAKTQPFEHRMQPYQLNGGWVIDDTYNGNIEGIRAGTALLRELPATRKVYVTPGLVDQGQESRPIHEAMGELIARSGAQLVVLIHNSVTPHIQAGLKAGHYNGELRIEDDPLQFYTHLGQFVAAGDLVLMQNDWPDNYR